MLRKNKIRLAILLAVAFFSIEMAAAQESSLSTFSPYSLFGLGDLVKQGSAVNRSMAGTGVGIRDRTYINFVNPASVTKRDTLSFMFDFGVLQKNIYSTDGDRSSPYNVFNISHIVLSSPIYKKSAFMVGITPVSNIGYDFVEYETDDEIINEMGFVAYPRFGSGSVNKVFLGAAMTLFKNISIGAEGQYYFGNLNHTSSVGFSEQSVIQFNSLRGVTSGRNESLKGIGAKIGLQYEQPLQNDVSFTLGATWSFGSKLRGDREKYIYASSYQGQLTDTVEYELSKTSYNIPAELGLGISLRKNEKWMFGLDYVRQDWSRAAFYETPGIDFRPAVNNSFRLGFEYIPNRYDVRYYLRRIPYRGGVYYDTGYFSISGQPVSSFGITFGSTFSVPGVFHNGIGVSVDMGQRGGLHDKLVRERYIMLNFSISLHEIWFRKFKYD